MKTNMTTNMTATTTTTTTFSVIVIGGGVAGIAAAAMLHEKAGIENTHLPDHQRKIHITLLEARDRLGGRVYTDRVSSSTNSSSSSSSDGDTADNNNQKKKKNEEFFVERGAAWIHSAGDPNNPIANLARQLGKDKMYPSLLNDIVVYEEIIIPMPNADSNDGSTDTSTGTFARTGARKVPKRVLRMAMAERNEQEGRINQLAEQMFGKSSSSSSSSFSSNSGYESSSSSSASDSSSSNSVDDDDDDNKVTASSFSSSKDISLAAALCQLGIEPTLSCSSSNNNTAVTPLQERIASWLWIREAIDCGSSLSELSFHAWWDQDYDNHAAHASGAGFGEALVLDGYDTIINAMAARLPSSSSSPNNKSCIEYNAVVKAIIKVDGNGSDGGNNVGGGGVEVQYEQHGSTKTLLADAVICTIPLGCLLDHDVQFIPATKGLEKAGFVESSSQHTHRKKRVEMGLLNWVVLKFPEPFWQQPGGESMEEDRVDDHDSIGWLPLPNTESNIPAPIEYTNLHEQTPGTLGTQFPGKEAEKLELCTDDEIIEACMGPLRKIYGSKCLEPTRVSITRWKADPFAKGSFSMLPVNCGDQADANKSLAGPIGGKPWQGRLLFAGEATSTEHSGTVRGAYETGEREAERLLKRFG